ncbi:MAG: hypothetical protein ACYC9H_14855 [Sulfuricaulis sp.]
MGAKKGKALHRICPSPSLPLENFVKPNPTSADLTVYDIEPPEYEFDENKGKTPESVFFRHDKKPRQCDGAALVSGITFIEEATARTLRLLEVKAGDEAPAVKK